MTRTNVFATKEEIEILRALVPYTIFGGVEQRSILERCQAMAREHGLPEIHGRYGCDLETGEFVSMRTRKYYQP